MPKKTIPDLITKVYHQSVKTGGKDNWRTPKTAFEYFNHSPGFDLDAAADETNHLCPIWYGPGGLWPNALNTSWELYSDRPTYVWCNPPYSQTPDFLTKIAQEVLDHNVYVTALLAARTDTKVFHNLVLPYADVLYFVKGRIAFGSPEDGTPYKRDAAPFPSMVVTFKPGGRREGTITVETIRNSLLNDPR